MATVLARGPLLLLVVLLSACGQEATQSQMVQSKDAGAADGPTPLCGNIITCLAYCAQKLDPNCVPTCCAGLNEQSCKRAQELALCAVINCAIDIPNPVRLAFCLPKSCGHEFVQCGPPPGLPTNLIPR